jgi:hypothetical protein
MHRVGNAIALGGVAALAGAYLWWSAFYTEVQRFLGVNGPPPIECLYHTGGPCRLVAHIAGFVAGNPYEPSLFWIGLAAVVVGVLFRAVTYPRASREENPPPRPRIEPHF